MSSRSDGSARAGRGAGPRLAWLERLALLAPALVLAGVLAARSETVAAPLSASGSPAAGSRVLRVCADPNNLPFSNRRGEGFDNKIAELLARDLGARVAYTWWPQRRSFLRNTLDAGACDVVIGVPSGYPRALTTRPYYRSTYVIVSRANRRLRVRSIDDPALRRLRIGVHYIGEDSPPPVEALRRRHIVENVVPFSIFGDYGTPNPPARLIDAVADGAVDVAIAWGPLSGYFARREPVPLVVAALQRAAGAADPPFVFDIAAGVRLGDTARRDELQRALDRQYAAVRRILTDYGVPLVAAGAPPAHEEGR